MMPLLLIGTDPSSQSLSIFDPVSPPAEAIRDLSVLVFAITGFIFIAVEGILIYSMIRFRRRPAARTGVTATHASAGTTSIVATEVPEPEPPQVYGSKPIEIAWTAAPALVVFVLVLVTARTLWAVNLKPPPPRPGDNTLFVTLIGRQWWWQFNYDQYNGQELGFITANELHIPVSEEGLPRRVYLTLRSADVAHSFWVPRLAGKTDLIPGQVNSMWFQTARPGLYLGQCAEYCGTQHANMLLRVYVDSPDDFQSWLANQQKPAVEDADAAEGRSAFLARSCINCHHVRGTPARGTYAPDLTHLMSRQTLAAGVVANTPGTLHRWVEDPQPIKPGCLMPAFGLSPRDRDAIVHYLLTLR
jgi:cytochrome c oxidase subunit 2